APNGSGPAASIRRSVPDVPRNGEAKRTISHSPFRRSSFVRMTSPAAQMNRRLVSAVLEDTNCLSGDLDKTASKRETAFHRFLAGPLFDFRVGPRLALAPQLG